MQLNLFEDNKPGVLLNIANEFIRSRDFVQAISVYEQLRDEYPGDRQSTALLEMVTHWQDALSTMNLADPGNFSSIWGRFGSITHGPLRSSVLRIVIDTLWALPDSERIYRPPQCHFGHVLMEAGQNLEAAECFYKALSGPGIPRGKFLAWRGDALTLAHKETDALHSYLDAFLDDPASVDVQFIKNSTIRDLYSSLCQESTDEREGEGEVAWLPVWGWFEGVFTFPLVRGGTGQDSMDSVTFEAEMREGKRSVPRLWFDMLTSAERLRATARDGREMAAIRRLMKKASSCMFDRYLTIMGGRR